MNIIFSKYKSFLCIAVVTALFFLYGINHSSATGINIILSGEEEVPPVKTSAFGKSNIIVANNKSIIGTVSTKGMVGVAAHIHEGAHGKNGPIIITLKKVSANEWEIPPETRLTEGQFANYKAGNLYLNVHSATYKIGEIRGQIIDSKFNHHLKD